VGKKIMGLADAGKIEGVKVFHAGTTGATGHFSPPADGCWG